jgi:cyclophilin family peptidyl-prolyl cis-trans isomerase
MSQKTTIALVIAAVLLVFGGALVAYSKSRSSSSDATQQTPIPDSAITKNDTPVATTPATPTSTNPTTPAMCTRQFDENKLKNDKVTIAGKVVTLSIKDYGDIKIAFYDKDAPKTVENFLRLTNSGYYDCVTFHRVIKGFMIQGGDPTGTGSGGQSAFGAKFADELNPETPSYKAGYKKGIVAMANAGANTNGSQFFIMHADYPLPNNYTIFGHVIAGQDVVDKIATSKTDASDRPVTPVQISKAVISNQ